MNDKKITEMEWDNCPFKKIIINPFDAMMIVVVRRLDESYHELKNCKLPVTETEFTIRNAKLCFYRELIKQSIDTEFLPEEIVALYENEELACSAWMIWNDLGCPTNKMLSIIAKLSIDEPIQKTVADLLM